MMHCAKAAWFVLLYAAAALAQSPDQQAFETASVKASASQSGRGRVQGGPDTPDPGRITFTSVPLLNVIMRAYDVKAFQVSAPDWMSTQRYDITAKIPPGASRQDCNRMLQNLLAERFHLVLHRETKELPGYELITGRGGSKLRPAGDSNAPPAQVPAGLPKTDASGFPQLDGPGLLMMEGVRGKSVVVFLNAKAQPLSALVDLLSREFRMPILDKTALTGKFDFKLEFAPLPPGALPPPTAADAGPEPADEAPNLMTAVQQQLGLRLNPAKVPTAMLMIERAEKVPSEN